MKYNDAVLNFGKFLEWLFDEFNASLIDDRCDDFFTADEIDKSYNSNISILCFDNGSIHNFDTKEQAVTHFLNMKNSMQN